MSGYPLNDDDFDGHIMQIKTTCDLLEESRDTLIATVELVVSAQCKSSVQVQKIREALAAYHKVRDDIGSNCQRW